MPNTLPHIGTAVFERELPAALSLLWEGPLTPTDMPTIELALRAFLMCPKLILSQFHGPWRGLFEGTQLETGYHEAFHDHLLDYEFLHPAIKAPRLSLAIEESSFLENLIKTKLGTEARNVVPNWASKMGEAFAYLDAWYKGMAPTECEETARVMLDWEDHDYPLSEESLYSHWIFSKGPNDHASYLVECHRAGLQVYGISPIVRICQEHLFSLWPSKLLEPFDERYREVMRELRGPGIAVELPPLLAVLLTRSPSRKLLPETLRDMRNEYEEARDHLWEMLTEMWMEPNLKNQVRILQKLQMASSSLFETSFSKRLDVLSIGLSLSQLTPGGLAATAKALREHDMPNARVNAVSFAAKLAKDFRAIDNVRSSLSRILSPSEFEDFGL